MHGTAQSKRLAPLISSLFDPVVAIEFDVPTISLGQEVTMASDQ